MSDSSSKSGQELSPHFRDLRACNPEAIINAYTAANPGPLTAAIRATLGTLSHIDIRAMIRKIIDTITDADFRRQFLEAIKVWIETHPWHTAFLIVGIVLLANPLAIAGFGALGPVAGREFQLLSSGLVQAFLPEEQC
jgi:di/tricarboxylate transporter